MRLHIFLPARLDAELRAYCALRGFKISSLIAALINEYLQAVKTTNNGSDDK